jgi:hypothetical protein
MNIKTSKIMNSLMFSFMVVLCYVCVFIQHYEFYQRGRFDLSKRQYSYTMRTQHVWMIQCMHVWIKTMVVLHIKTGKNNIIHIQTQHNEWIVDYNIFLHFHLISLHCTTIFLYIFILNVNVYSWVYKFWFL